MKRKFLLLGIIFLFVSGFVTSRVQLNQFPPSHQLTSTLTPIPKNFINCIFNWGYKSGDPSLYFSNYLSTYRDSLKFNSVHSYYEDSDIYGNYNTPLSGTQIGNVHTLMSSVYNSNLVGIYERNKISKLCNGQRVVYEIDSLTNRHIINDGFCYTQRDSNTCTSVIDSNRTVLFCNTAVNNPGFIAKKIYENMQHSDIFVWAWDDAKDWKIRPMMRIDSSNYLSTDTTPVVAIVTYNFANERIDSSIVRKSNFQDASGLYKGNYIDIFNNLNLTVNGGKSTNQLNHGYYYIDSNGGNEGKKTDTCKVDFKVYWFKQVNVWFDKMTVDNPMAKDLFSGILDTNIFQEVNNFVDSTNYTFFVDEMTYSNYPCVDYVYKKMKAKNSNARLSCALTLGNNIRGFREYNTSEPQILKKYFTSIEPQIFTLDAHEISWGNYLPQNFINNQNPSEIDPKIKPIWLQNNFNYNEFLQKKVLGDKSELTGRTPSSTYSYYHDRVKPGPQGSFIYQVRKARDLANTNSRMIVQPQIHSWVIDSIGKYSDYGHREPLNEEIQVQSMISIAHGGDGLCWFIYQSITFDDGSINYHHGFTDIGNMDHRIYNMYGQNKWSYVKNMNQKLLNWKPHLDNINWKEGLSVHKDGANYGCINDIKSINPNSEIKPICNETNDYTECPEERYWELGFFEPIENNDLSKYFIAVNRRCIPKTATDSTDIRYLKIKFETSSLSDFDNWKLIDVNSGNSVTFDKNNQGSGGYLDLGSSSTSLGYFLPGEGKLFKLVPVMQSGGTFVTNENLSDLTFNCNGTVYTNSYNLTFNEGVNINFADNVQLKMKKGTFTSGTITPNPKICILKAKDGGEWNGIYFDSTDVRMAYTTIKGTKKDASNSGYALNFIDCDTVIVNKTYITTTDSSGCINMYYHSGAVTNPLISLTYDSLNVNIAGNPPLNMYSYSSLSGNFKAEHNVIKNFNASGGGTGVIMTGFINFAFNDNFFRSFAQAFYSIHSSPDFWANFFNNGAYGSGNPDNIFGLYSTFFDLSSNAGGYNTVTNFSGNCIYLDASYVDIHNGGNYFNMYDTLGYHLRGYFPDTVSNTNQDGRGNCFVLHDVVRDSAHTRINVILGDLTPVNYRLLPFASGCNPADNTNTQQKIVSERSIIKDEKVTKEQKPVRTQEINTSKSSLNEAESRMELSRTLYSDMKKALKNEDYKTAKEKSLAILSLDVENMYSVDAVRKLFHSVALMKNDKSVTISKSVSSQLPKTEASSKSSGELKIRDMSGLKSYYESYILSHPSNNVIISEMFYFIQKCKINLGEYESALNGYKAIMEKNPYSMAGLNAKWEYSDLQLLISSRGNNGTGGSESNIGGTVNLDELNAQQQYERLTSLIEDPKDGKDKPGSKKSTNEDKRTVTNNVIKSLDASTQKDKNTVKSLEEKINSNVASAEEVKEYRKRLLYKELVKIQKVNNTQEQIAMIQSDLSRIFALDKTEDNTVLSKEPSVIAYDYKLNQNYPNPFNPSTKISYEIKNTGFVSLRIYDLLGREIAELINETKEAGRYTIDFNATKYSLASGIYFYRIKAGEFVDTKRMVLVK